ncbi:MAG: hypothetical protein AAF560_22695 [Acidobacteriota bacterium]
MPFSAEQKRAQEHVSATARKFLDFVEQRPHLLDESTFEGLFRGAYEVVPTPSGIELGEDYLQPWPILIDETRRRRFERAGVAIARLVRGIPERFFANDPKAVAEFYGLENELSAALLLSSPSFIHETLGRGDFMETESGLKCIEVNFGNLGGWQHSAYASLFTSHPDIKDFTEAHGLELVNRNSIRALLRHVVRDSLRRLPPGSKQLNVMVVASDDGNTSLGSHPLAHYEREFRQVLRWMGGGRITGRLDVVKLGQLEFHDGWLEVDGIRYQSVIEQNAGEPSTRIFRSAKAGKVCCYCGLIGTVTGDKRNLALLSEHQSSPRFSFDEQRCIARYVPWTRHLIDASVERGGRHHPMRQLLLDRQRDMVIKAGLGFAGYQVVVGRFVDSAQWQKRLDEALEVGGWIAQEYLETLPQTYQQGKRGAGAYDVIWGLYVFGDSYGGEFFRMAPRAQLATVNIAQGGRIGVVFKALKAS